MKRILRWFFIWRVLLFIPLALAIMFLPFRENSQFTTIWQYTNKYSVVENDFVYPWANFDGVHYIAIASRWYVDEGRFLPLFPITIGVVAAPLSLIWPILPFGPATFWAGILVSTITTILALYFTAKLLHLDYKTKTIELALFLLLISPVAFFLASIYSEGMFLLLSVLSLYFARKKQWAFAALSAMFLSITRLTGILIIVPLLWEYYELEVKPQLKSDRLSSISLKKNKQLLLFAIIPTLLLLYSLFNYMQWGDYIYFVHAHGSLGNSREVANIVFPFVTVYRYIKIFLTVSLWQYEFWIAVLEFGAVLYATWSLFLSWKLKMRTSYVVFATVMITLPLFSGTFSGFPRYILPIFPFFLAQALWFKQLIKNKKTGKIIHISFVALSILLQAVLLMLFARGYYVS